MELQVYRRDGSEAGRTVTLEPSVFDVDPSDHAIWLDVRRIQANGRQGTHKTKERSEVAGSTRKLYRQKGTGMSRAGSARSPIRRSGGTTFGPRPRTYSLNLNRKTQQAARRSALTYKAREEGLRVVEDFSFETPSTRELRDLVQTLGLSDRKVLILTSGHEKALYQSSRNIKKVKVEEARNVSTYDVLNAGIIVVQEGGLQAITDILGKVPA